MAKMRVFKFWNEAGDEKEKESMSLKKAVMSVQGDFKDDVIGVEFISKKGKKIINNWSNYLGKFIKVVPNDFKEVLMSRSKPGQYKKETKRASGI